MHALEMTLHESSMSLYRETFSHIRSFPPAFWVVIGATLMNQIGNMAFVFLVLYMTQHMRYSLPQASLAFATFCGSMLLTGLLGGGLVDRLGVARMMMGSLLANGIVLILFPLIHHYPAILLMCLVWGFAYGLYRPSSQTLVSHLSAAGLHKITFSVYRLSINLGMSIGPAIGGYLAAHSYAAIFLANGIANLLASTILIAGLARTHWIKYRPALQHKMEFSFIRLKHDPLLRIFLFGMTPVSMVFFQHESTLAVFLYRDLKFPLAFYGWLFTINTLMIVFFELALNVATMNWPYRTNFILGSLLITIGFAGMLYASQGWHIILLTMIWTLGEMILYPSASSYIADISSPAHRGSYMSLLGTASNMGMLIGPWSGAIVMEYLGATGLWTACGLWGVLSIMIFRYAREPEARPRLQTGEEKA